MIARSRRVNIGLHLALVLALMSSASGVELFNGKNLDGFTTWLVDTKGQDPRRVFTVTNGSIRISGDGLGYLSTKEDYDNYRLTVEWKWGGQNWSWGNRVGAARDSGVFLHTIGPEGNSHDGGGAFKAGIECNLFQGATGDLLLIRGSDKEGKLLAPRLSATIHPERDTDGWPFWQLGGQQTNLVRWGRLNWFGKDRRWRDTLDFRGTNDLEKPVGEWNLTECTCIKDTVEVRVNGVLANRALNVWPARGRILLQCEGSEILFRRVQIESLK